MKTLIPKQLLNVKKLVTHANCPDGMASAMIIRDVLMELPVEFMNYNTDAHINQTIEPGIMFCDFSPHKDNVEELSKLDTIVLDHHKYAKDIVDEFGELGFFGDEKTEPGVCGAVLAYEHVWKPLKQLARSDEAKVAEFARLAGIRDTFVKDSPDFIKACKQAEVLGFFDWKYWSQRRPCYLTSTEWGVAEMLWDKKQSKCKSLAEDAMRFALSGKQNNLTGAILQAGKDTSDVAEILRAEEGVSLVIGFTYTTIDDELCMLCSCRSDDKIDVGTFAKFLGGGGHSKAAGFKLKVNINNDPNPYKLLMDLANWHIDC